MLRQSSYRFSAEGGVVEGFSRILRRFVEAKLDKDWDHKGTPPRRSRTNESAFSQAASGLSRQKEKEEKKQNSHTP
jgi:hypothetical protein